MKNQTIQNIYNYLMKLHGPQGWWPLTSLHSIKKSNPTKTGSFEGYHPNDFSYPKTEAQRFEICLGAILTQNTSWVNAEKAILNLKSEKCLSSKRIEGLDTERLAKIIKPAGYFNQKARKIKEFNKFYRALKGKTPKRDELLEVWGIGPETCDSILLYAYKVSTFVVDAYTKRILSNIDILDKNENYNDIKGLFEKNLPKNLKIYQEYHALIVEHAKSYYSQKKLYDFCPLKKLVFENRI